MNSQKQEMKKISYALGLSMGNNFRATGIDNLDLEEFAKGLEDVFKEQKPSMSYDEAQQLINNFFSELQDKRMELNKKAGEEFLEINKNKAGVVTL